MFIIFSLFTAFSPTGTLQFLKNSFRMKDFFKHLGTDYSFWQLLNCFGRVIWMENNQCFNNSYLSALIAESEEQVFLHFSLQRISKKCHIHFSQYIECSVIPLSLLVHLPPATSYTGLIFIKYFSIIENFINFESGWMRTLSFW